MKRFKIISLLLIGVFLLTACGGAAAETISREAAAGLNGPAGPAAAPHAGPGC